jgi:hypothetical protein
MFFSIGDVVKIQDPEPNPDTFFSSEFYFRDGMTQDICDWLNHFKSNDAPMRVASTDGWRFAHRPPEERDGQRIAIRPFSESVVPSQRGIKSYRVSEREIRLIGKKCDIFSDAGARVGSFFIDEEAEIHLNQLHKIAELAGGRSSATVDALYAFIVTNKESVITDEKLHKLARDLTRADSREIANDIAMYVSPIS